jgi:hypothetical protein
MVGPRVAGENGYYSVQWSKSPKANPFRDWLLDSSRHTYASFLAAHPLEALASAWRNRTSLISAPAYGHGRPAVPTAVQDVVYPPSLTAFWIALVAVLAIASLAAVRGGASILWWVPGSLLVLTIPYALFIWLASAREVERHALLAAVLPRLGLLILLLFALDALLSPRARSVRGGPVPKRAG